MAQKIQNFCTTFGLAHFASPSHIKFFVKSFFITSHLSGGIKEANSTEILLDIIYPKGGLSGF